VSLRPWQASQRRDLGRHRAHHGLPLFFPHPGTQSPLLTKASNAHRDDNSGAWISDEVAPLIAGLSGDDLEHYTLLTSPRIHPRG
jgi:hypothetical protein